eukprot:6581006-Pyramimonas_sp.AAC.1
MHPVGDRCALTCRRSPETAGRCCRPRRAGRRCYAFRSDRSIVDRDDVAAPEAGASAPLSARAASRWTGDSGWGLE